MPKCDICKVTIKKAGTITVKCCGYDLRDAEQMSDDNDEKNVDGTDGNQKD